MRKIDNNVTFFLREVDAMKMYNLSMEDGDFDAVSRDISFTLLS